MAKLDETSNITYQGSVMYYDNKNRVIQTISGNHLSGLDKEYTAYNFSDTPFKENLTYNYNGNIKTQG
ncbi:MAG: hypothetical protein LUH22_01485 [Bacteroides sp.]|nr:hypothetical protein [Bacteroides sp.]